MTKTATTSKKATTKKATTTTTKTKKGLSLTAKAKKIGLFAPKTLSSALADICGAKKLSNVEVTKAIWKYIKAKKLNDGRIIKPDDKLKGIFPVKSLDMLKMGSFVKKHIS